jgi:hypothetical protein
MMAQAEITTAQAAESFAEYARRFPQFETLFASIEAGGYPLGVEGRLRVFAVLSRLNAIGEILDNGERLANYLVPVLAASKHEQEAVRDAILGWARPGSPNADKEETKTAVEAVAPPEARRLERADHAGGTLAYVATGLVAATFAALIAYSRLSESSPNAAAAARSVVTYSQPVLTLDLGLQPFWRGVLEDALSRLSFGAVVLILGLSFAAWRNETKGRLIRRTDETDLVEAFQFKTVLPDWFRSADARAAFDRLKRVRLFETDLIDVKRTVARSTRAGGLPLIVNHRVRELPNYVLLVDRAKADDLASLFARTVEAALIEARIVYSRYDYSGGLDRLNPVRGGDEKDIVDAEYLPFSVIASRHAGERLIVVGSGKGFFEVPGFRYSGRRAARTRTIVPPGTPLPEMIHLREFGAAALITPAPQSAWGENEERLHQLGFAVYAADAGGVATLAAQLMSEPGAEETALRAFSDDDRFLARLDREAVRLSSPTPPALAEIERLARNLKIWAGRSDIYTLLAAIAAFPKIDPAFTFVLADMFLPDGMDSASFARLMRLPWIRNGYMPDWLRIALVNGLDPEERKLVQIALSTMLESADRVKQLKQERTRPSREEIVADFKVARDLPRGTLQALISRITPGKILSADERIFYSVLHNYRLDPEREAIAPEAPEVIAELIDAPERTRRNQVRLAVIGLAALAALAQPWIWVGLTIAAVAADDQLRALSGLIGPSSGVLFQGATTALLLLTFALWLVNVTRLVPMEFAPFSKKLPRGQLINRLLDPQVYGGTALVLAMLCVLGTRSGPAPADAKYVTSVVLMTAVIVACAWVLAVTPERWWNTRSADNELEMQIARDPLTGMLGTWLVVAIWAVPWFSASLNLASYTDTGAPFGRLLLGSCLACAGSVASVALARRWLIGTDATGALHRLWMDAGFALLAFLSLSAIARVLGPLLPPSAGDREIFLLGAIVIAACALYGAQLKAALGLRDTRPAWGPLIDGALTAVAVGIVVAQGIKTQELADDLRLLISAAIGGLVCGTFAAFRFHRADDGDIGRVWLALRCAAVAATILATATATILATAIALGLAFSPANLLEWRNPLARGTYPALLIWLILPAALTVWPMFRVLAVRLRKDAPTARWRAIVKSPWWAVPAMWLACLVWHAGTTEASIKIIGINLAAQVTAMFSFWPLALPIAAYTWWRHGERAFVPLLIGTLPLLIRISGPVPSLYTPGGVWAAFAVLLVARLAVDEPFRLRLLRREHLSWPEAFAIVALLSADVDIPLWTSPTTIGGGSPVEIAASALVGTGVSLHVDPGPMRTVVAFIIGASRMRAGGFTAAVLAFWLAPYILTLLSAGTALPAGLIGTSPGEVTSLFLVLYGARAWRTYAAAPAEISTTEQTDSDERRRAGMKTQGIFLSCTAAITVTMLLSGLVPTITIADATLPFGKALSIAPGFAETLALVLLCGLIAPNLWRDHFTFSRRFSNQLIQFASRSAYVPLIAAGLYFTLARAIGPASGGAPVAIGVSVEADVLPSGLGMTGLIACVLSYLLLGMTLRVLGERCEDEDWMLALYRVWSVDLAARITKPRAKIETEPESMAGARAKERSRFGGSGLSPLDTVRVEISTIQQELAEKLRGETYEIRSELASGNIRRALARLSDMIRSLPPERANTFHETAMVLTLEYQQVEKGWFAGDRPSEESARTLERLLQRVLDLCDAIKNESEIKFTPPDSSADLNAR